MIPFHPLANLFPLIEGREFDELVADVGSNGLRQPIVMFDDQILDGRNRYRAAVAAGMFDEDLSWRGSVHFVAFDYHGPTGYFRQEVIDGGPLAYVLSLNLHRRHLSETQRSLIAAEIATLRQGRPAEWRRGDEKPANRRDSVPALKQAEAAELLNVSERNVQRGRQVVDHGAPELVEAVRRDAVAISAAAELAKLPVTEQLALMRGADPRAIGRLMRERREQRQLEKRSRRDERETALAAQQQALPDRRYGVILADPEWRFEPWSRDSGMDRAADNHYPTSPLEAIKARPVGDIAADDCVLLLWATAPMLPQALEVMAAWGFAYKSHTIWRKAEAQSGAGVVLGTGYWFRIGHELLLLGTRGAVPAPAMGAQWPSIVDAPPRRHSQKPDWVYQLVADYYPNLPKIELNARARREGWDAWGYEAPEAGEAAEGPTSLQNLQTTDSAVAEPLNVAADSGKGSDAPLPATSSRPVGPDGDDASPAGAEGDTDRQPNSQANASTGNAATAEPSKGEATAGRERQVGGVGPRIPTATSDGGRDSQERLAPTFRSSALTDAIIRAGYTREPVDLEAIAVDLQLSLGLAAPPSKLQVRRRANQLRLGSRARQIEATRRANRARGRG